MFPFVEQLQTSWSLLELKLEVKIQQKQRKSLSPITFHEKIALQFGFLFIFDKKMNIK